jgi:hypothetical protein
MSDIIDGRRKRMDYQGLLKEFRLAIGFAMDNGIDYQSAFRHTYQMYSFRENIEAVCKDMNIGVYELLDKLKSDTAYFEEESDGN